MGDKFTHCGQTYYYGQKARDHESGLVGLLSYSPMGYEPQLLLRVNGKVDAIILDPANVEILENKYDEIDRS